MENCCKSSDLDISVMQYFRFHCEMLWAGMFLFLLIKKNNGLTWKLQRNSAVFVRVSGECMCAAKEQAADKLGSADNNPPAAAITARRVNSSEQGSGWARSAGDGTSCFFSPISGSECILMWPLHHRRREPREERQKHHKLREKPRSADWCGNLRGRQRVLAVRAGRQRFVIVARPLLTVVCDCGIKH